MNGLPQAFLLEVYLFISPELSLNLSTINVGIPTLTFCCWSIRFVENVGQKLGRLFQFRLPGPRKNQNRKRKGERVTAQAASTMTPLKGQ